MLVGLPARHLLIAGTLHRDDLEFAPLFADFVLDYAGDSDESIDRRIFELRDGRLTVVRPVRPRLSTPAARALRASPSTSRAAVRPGEA